MIITTTHFVNINNKHIFKQSLLLWCKTTFTTLLQDFTTHSFGMTNVTETKEVQADSINIKNEQKLNYSQYSGYASSVIEASKGGRVARGHQVLHTGHRISYNIIYDV